MQGRRVYDEFPGNPGEYRKNVDGTWLLCLPTGIHGTINNKIWSIIEHEDGTITVSPSILTTVASNPELTWHGYLEKGIWRTV